MFFALSGIQAQEFVSGIIYETTTNNQERPLAGENVYWLNSKIETITNNKGTFEMSYQSYLFKTDRELCGLYERESQR